VKPPTETARELHVQKAAHLPAETLAVTIPPDFLHPRNTVRVHIFQPDHFFQPKTPVRSAYAAGLHPAVRSLADAEAGNHIVHHDRARLNTPRETFAAHPVARPHACCKPVFGVVGQSNRFIVIVESHHRQQRTESLLPHDAHFVGRIGKHGWSVKIRSHFIQPRSARQNSGSANLRVFQVRFHDA
jgi:hypothetical protein